MGKVQLHRDAVWIVVGRILYGKRETPPVDQTAESIFLEVEKACGALDLRQSSWVSLLQ